MTDATAPLGSEVPKSKHAASLFDEDARTKKRNAAEKRFQMYGIGAIGIGIFFLVVLLVSIVRSGIPAFTQTFIEVPVYLNAEVLDKNGNRDPADLATVSTFGYAPLIDQAIFDKVQADGLTTEFEEAVKGRIFQAFLSPGDMTPPHPLQTLPPPS